MTDPVRALFRTMERVSSKATKVIGNLCGERFPFYYVCEYPRAGGTWLADMVADYLQVPFPKNTIFPQGCKGVIHSHWGYSSRLRRVAYMYRDGRDTVVSLFFYCTRPLRDRDNADPGQLRYIERRYPYLLEPGLDLDDCAALFPRFIED